MTQGTSSSGGSRVRFTTDSYSWMGEGYKKWANAWSQILGALCKCFDTGKKKVWLSKFLWLRVILWFPNKLRCRVFRSDWLRYLAGGLLVRLQGSWSIVFGINRYKVLEVDKPQDQLVSKEQSGRRKQEEAGSGGDSCDNTDVVYAPMLPEEWKDFGTFDAWVTNSLHDVEEMVGLVVFHPRSLDRNCELGIGIERWLRLSASWRWTESTAFPMNQPVEWGFQKAGLTGLTWLAVIGLNHQLTKLDKLNN